MKKFKGTKGEWSIKGNSILSEKYSVIANVGGDTREWSEIDANTSIIAAAPELLEALQKISNLVYANFDRLSPVAVQLCVQSEAAINKALSKND